MIVNNWNRSLLQTFITTLQCKKTRKLNLQGAPEPSITYKELFRYEGLPEAPSSEVGRGTRLGSVDHYLDVARRPSGCSVRAQQSIILDEENVGA